MKRIFINTDGTIRIMHPVSIPDGKNIKDFLDEEAKKDTSLIGLSFVDVEDNQIPKDRSKRHLWRHKDGKILEGGT